MTEVLSTLATKAGWYSLQSDSTSDNILILETTTSKGFSGPHVSDFPSYSACSDPSLCTQLDDVVRSNYTPPIHEFDSVTELVSNATLARGYLCFLFSATPVVERERTATGELFEEHTHSGNNLNLHLLNFILGRLHGLISEVVYAVRGNIVADDNNYSLDVAAATGILYTGLAYVVEGLKRGMLRPLCGGHELTHLLIESCSSISSELIQRQRTNCVRFENWAAHISGSIEALRSNVSIQSMILTLERRPHQDHPIYPPANSSWPLPLPEYETNWETFNTEYSVPNTQEVPGYLSLRGLNF